MCSCCSFADSPNYYNLSVVKTTVTLHKEKLPIRHTKFFLMAMKIEQNIILMFRSYLKDSK